MAARECLSHLDRDARLEAGARVRLGLVGRRRVGIVPGVDGDSGRARSVGREQAEFVDGGVIGPPARQMGSTRLYLSGARADEIRSMFDGSFVQAQAIEGGPGAASALKMCYAAWTKGSAALLLAVAALARREGVQGALVDEWRLSQQDLPGQLQGALISSAPRAWRFTGEMQEIAKTFLDQEMPDGFHLAAAEIYRRLAEIPSEHQQDGEAMLKRLAPE